MSGSRMSRKWRMAFLIVAALGVTLLAFATWYKARYSMDIARTFEVNDPASKPRVLIATQGSEFKEAVVAALLEHLKTRSAYVKVIDVSSLPGIEEKEWDAMVLLHTWEMQEPQKDASAFVDRVHDKRRIVVLSTSGAGDFRMQGVDAISSASVVADAPSIAADLGARVDAVLAGVGPVVAPAASVAPEQILTSGEAGNDRRAAGSAIAAEFAAELRAALEKSLREKGPAGAIGVCRTEAPAIAARLSVQHAASVKRTGLRVRNAGNAPQPWQARVLEEFQAQLAAGKAVEHLDFFQVRPDGSAGYLKAIGVQPLCLACHGESIASEVEAEIAKHYPSDQATGFRVGDLRGAFSIEWPADAAHMAEQMR